MTDSASDENGEGDAPPYVLTALLWPTNRDGVSRAEAEAIGQAIGDVAERFGMEWRVHSGPTPKGPEPVDLNTFLRLAWFNTLASQESEHEGHRRLREIDSLFHRLIDSMRDALPPAAAFLLIRSHSAYLGAARMALSGQVAETYPLLRMGLEAALYALHIARNPEAGAIWAERMESDESRKHCRREFGWERVAATLELADARLGEIARMQYEACIDLGAHPNALGIISVIEHQQGEEDHTFQVNYMPGPGQQFNIAMRLTAQVGIAILKVGCMVFPDHVTRVALPERIDRAAEGL